MAEKREAAHRVNGYIRPLRAQKARTYIVVRYGKKGEQLAFYFGATPGGRIKVKKWVANSRRWTGRLTVHPTELLREATAEDLRRFRATECVG